MQDLLKDMMKDLPPPAAGTAKVKIMHHAVPKLLARPQYEQRTPEWYEVRRFLMTASDAAGALGIPAFKGQRNVRESLLKQKVSGTFTGNHMTRWGQDNEDQVRERAMQAVGEIAWEVGLVVHPELTWLGASPDGVTNTGRLIEIKCPYKRKPIPEETPHHYWPQIQVQLECTDLDSCWFVQWQPAHLAVDNEEVFSIILVERDRQWFASIKDDLKSFHTDLMAMRETYVPPPPPPPPTCLVLPSMYNNNTKEDSESSVSPVEFPGRSKRTFVIESDAEESDTMSTEYVHLRKKLQDALDALDAWHKKI
jgi:putative phage-type endonuclease